MISAELNYNNMYDAQVSLIDDMVNGKFKKNTQLTEREMQFLQYIASQKSRAGDNLVAFRLYVFLVMCDPFNIDFQVGLSSLAMEIGENQVALQAASIVISLNLQDPRGYYLSGCACFAIGAFIEAEEDFKEALRLASIDDFSQISRNRAIIASTEKKLKTIAAFSELNGSSAKK